MSSQIIPFQFDSNSISVATDHNGDPWFIAKEVAEILGYDQTANGLKHCRRSSVLDDVNKINNLHPSTKWIPESDVYRMVMRSTLPNAERFQDWVVEEVLPSIRKTGRYEQKTVAPHVDTKIALDLFALSAKAARSAGFKGNMIALSANNFVRSTAGVDVLAHMGATHLIADPRGMTYTPTDIGGMIVPPLSARRVNLLLEAIGLQRKEIDEWIPTDAASGLYEWLDTSKRHANGTPIKQIKWFHSVVDKLNIYFGKNNSESVCKV